MSGIQMLMLGGSAGSSTLATYSLTTGNTGGAGTRYRGYDDASFAAAAIGSVTPGTFTLNGGTTLKTLLYDEAASQYVLQVAGGTNSGWSSLSVDGTFFLTRAAATYSTSLGNSFWTWTTTDTITNQAFGIATSNHTITFT